MKYYLSHSIVVFLSVFLFSCEGPEGPPGPQGEAGFDGDPGPEAVVLEYEGIDFMDPDYRAVINFYPDHKPLKTDAILVYALWETIELDNGGTKDVWRLLPQTTFPTAGTLVYNYDHSYQEVVLMLEANFNIFEANLGAVALNNWIIRLVFVPGYDFFNSRTKAPVDFSDYEAVKEYYHLPEAPVHRNTIKRL